jgi:hypothetical protein
MYLLDNKYYIIRIGDFATNGNKKILYSLFSICLCLEEYISTKSIDCFTIMIGSTLVWTFIEYMLSFSKTRVIKPMYITNYSGNKIKLNKYFGIFLQGFQEGGVVTTFGLYFGDRLLNINYLIYFHLFIGYIVINMAMKENNNLNVKSLKYLKKNNNVSKRQVNTFSSLCIMVLITFYNFKTLFLNQHHFYRQLKMFFVMIYVCTIWSIIAYYRKFRLVKIYIKDDNNRYISKKINTIDVIFILGYDIIFEIGIAYLTFYNWFII